MREILIQQYHMGDFDSLLEKKVVKL